MSAEPVAPPDSPPSPAASAPVRPRRRVLRAAGIMSVVLLLAAAGGMLWLRGRVFASLPQMEGERVLPGLTSTVRVERDALGVPTIRAGSRLDAARALGFLHAQERFFQMDLIRRRAAGELAELIGPAVVEMDRTVRVNRFRTVARGIWKDSPAAGRDLIEAYTAGVNAGLAALAERPFEYVLLRAQPAPWAPEDTILASLAMYIDLHDERGAQESARGLMRDLLPPPMYAFLTPPGTEWDAPLVGPAFAVPPIPGPEVFDTRGERPAASASRDTAAQRRAALERNDLESSIGSNNWAVAGTHSATGAAIVADDMHLGIGVPNTWYRASMVWPAAEGGEHRLTGVTLPGTPALVVGSTGRVAWAFTNSQGDWNDLVVLEPDPADAGRYLTPEGPRAYGREIERIRVKGAPDEPMEVLTTVWGPVLDTDHRGRRRALRWSAYDHEAVNLALMDLDQARDVDDAVALAARAGIPPQNFVVGDAGGRIAWTIVGRIPRRVGLSGREPESWADGTRRWNGWLEPAEYPRVVDPPAGKIWSANSRMVDGAMLAAIGETGYDLGARQQQIRDALLPLQKATLEDMRRIHLDDRALFLARWRDLLLKVLDERAVGGDARRAEFRRHVEGWGGRAAVDSVGYRLVRAFRLALAEDVFRVLTARCEAADARFDYTGQVWRFEGPLWTLATQRPAHLLDPRHRDWDAQLLASVDRTIKNLLEAGGTLAERTWGERNTTRVQHPLSMAVPALGRWLDMPRWPLPGDSHMPRFQSPRAGASQRMAVSPGREQEGYFHMPVGQSGHPLSPHYASGHAAWAKGDPTPFLPGPAVHTLTLKP